MLNLVGPTQIDLRGHVMSTEGLAALVQLNERGAVAVEGAICMAPEGGRFTR